MKRIFTVLIVMSMLLMSVSIRASALPAAPDISARSCILIHCGDGRVLYEKNADAKMLIASTTQIMTYMNRLSADAVVIGGGAAGLMCACTAAERGRSVIILEPNRDLGRKLRITGKGRCNLTNNCDIKTIMANIPGDGRFLYSALTAFPPEKVMYPRSAGPASSSPLMSSA